MAGRVGTSGNETDPERHKFKIWELGGYLTMAISVFDNFYTALKTENTECVDCPVMMVDELKTNFNVTISEE